MTPVLEFHSFTGMTFPIIEKAERADPATARRRAAQILRRRRSTDHIVSIIERGERWECLEPDDSSLIPDTAGFLWLREVYEFDHMGRCTECGDARRTGGTHGSEWSAAARAARRAVSREAVIGPGVPKRRRMNR